MSSTDEKMDCPDLYIVFINIYYSFIFLKSIQTVASPGFVARRGKAGNYVMGNSRLTSEPGAAAAR